MLRYKERLLVDEITRLTATIAAQTGTGKQPVTIARREQAIERLLASLRFSPETPSGWNNKNERKVTKPRAKKCRCKCLNEAQKVLADHNTRIALGFGILDGKQYIYLATEKINSKLRGHAKSVACTFCPFCGGRL